MKKATLIILGCASLLAACGSDSTTTPPPATTGQITLTGTTSFTTPHPGQAIRAALVSTSDGKTLDIQKTTVAPAGTSHAFSFTFTPVVDLSAAHKVRYWIDNNANDACDGTDHQWEVDAPSGQTSVSVSHNANFADVCATFTFPLTFVGGTSFIAPHATQSFKAALVRGTATTALDTQIGAVAAAGASSGFSVTFAPRLVIGEAYSVKLWIDSTANGTCDAPPPATPSDHQWSVPIPADFSTYQPTFTFAHAPPFTSVCTWFP